MKYYKAFNPDMTCKGFKFEIGKTYEEEKAEMCYSGFHFCENPLDCLNYYDLLDKNCNLINFAEVKPLDKIVKGNNEDTKRCTKKIKISAKLNLLGFIKASFDYISKTSKKNNKNSGYNSKVATSGDCSQVATSGYNSKVATSGYNSKVATSGDCSQVATSGNNSQVATSGYYSKVATSGYNSKVATSGYNSKVATSGDCSQVATSGDYSQVATSGYNSIIANIGRGGMAKGIKGTWITLAEYKDNKPYFVKSFQVDGVKIKENTFYTLKNKRLKEVKDND